MAHTAPAVELIVARQLAGLLAVPIVLIDVRGDPIFYNEPAESLFGRPFDEVDVLPFEERSAILALRREGGDPMPVDLLPGMLAIRERRPVYAESYFSGLDGVLRPLSLTAMPVMSADRNVLGALIFMWQGHGSPDRVQRVMPKGVENGS